MKWLGSDSVVNTGISKSKRMLFPAIRHVLSWKVASVKLILRNPVDRIDPVDNSNYETKNKGNNFLNTYLFLTLEAVNSSNDTLREQLEHWEV